MQKIGVFLSSRSALPASYVRAAEEVGALIGRTGRTLVYGGSSAGLMEVLARAVKAAGGRVYGVVPQVVADRGLESGCIDVTFRSADLSDRKAIMMRESELFVALPGGIGTLDEVFTVVAADSIGLCGKTVVLYNVDGCWDALLALLDDLRGKGLVSSQVSRFVTVASSPAELEALL